MTDREPQPPQPPQHKQPPDATGQRRDTLPSGDVYHSTEPQSGFGPVPLPFTTLGRYNVLKELGHGGMGTVYLAEDTKLGRQVALKVPLFAPRNAEKMQQRFMQEARLGAQLDHPNICRVFDVDVIDGHHVLSMEYIPGQTLSEFMKSGKQVSPRNAVALVRKVAAALQYAHSKQVIHRDLKPGNIMLPKSDGTRRTLEPRVMDLGLAKNISGTQNDLTKTGEIMGSPPYMPIEQWSGTAEKIGPAADIFSLGVILYELLTGQLPYDVEALAKDVAWSAMLLTQPPIRPSERKPEIDAALEQIVLRAIAKEAHDRYASMDQFVVALDGWLKGVAISETSQEFPASVAPQVPVRVPVRPPAQPPVPSQTFVTQVLPVSEVDQSQFIEETPQEPVTEPAGPPSKRRRKPGEIPPWALWTGGAALVLLLGIVIVFTTTPADEPPAAHMEASPAAEMLPAAPLPNLGGPDSPSASEANNAPPSGAASVLRVGSGTKAGETREITLPGGEKLVQVYIPPTPEDKQFTMGTPGATDDESPVQVTLTQGFWLGETEVTQGQWEAVMGTTPWVEYGDTDHYKAGKDYPATYVSHIDAEAFCVKLTELEQQAGRLPTGFKYSLPTEAQWEYACRAGTTGDYSFEGGESQLGDYAWFDKNAYDVGEEYAHVVRQKKKNPWGLFDMHGNVWEWCQDGYGEKLPGGIDPVVKQGSFRVFRGGCWIDRARGVRSAYRDRYGPGFRYGDLGFRLAMSPSGR